MSENKENPFEIVEHHKFSWSYIYTVNGRKRSISANSVNELKKFVLEKDLPWDYENYPDENITKSQYDNSERNAKPIEYSAEEPKSEATEYSEASQSLPRWAPSRRKYHSGKHSIDDY